jgi:hypothetical protein
MKTVVCAAVAMMGAPFGFAGAMEYFPTSSLLSAEAFVGPTSLVGEFDGDQVSAGTPTVANLDALVNHMGITAAATVDTIVDWRSHIQRFDMSATLTTSLARTGEVVPFGLAHAYTMFLGSAGFTVTEPTTIRIEADVIESVASAGFRVLFYRLDIDETFVDVAAAPDARVDALVTIEAGTYILNVDGFMFDPVFGQENQLGRSASASIALSITGVPAPFTAAAFAPLAILASRRRREVTR